MIIKYDETITKNFPGLFKIIQDSYIKSKILYLLDSSMRTGTNLRLWVETWMNEPISPEEKTTLLSIKDSTDYDEQVKLCLRWVAGNITYTPDTTQWKLVEKWQTPAETLTSKKGDCEDGAILLYRLCRLKGVPADRLWIMCGDVNGGGHCWLGYRPKCYPLNWAFMDWCYWYNPYEIEARNKFYIDKYNKVHEYKVDNRTQIKSNYYTIWWAFNEDTNVRNFIYGLGRNNEDLFKTSKSK